MRRNGSILLQEIPEGERDGKGERIMVVGRLVVAGIAWAVFAGTASAAEPVRQINACEAGRLPELADQVATETENQIRKAKYPEEVAQIIGRAQIDFLRILIRQNDEILRLNSAIRQLLQKDMR